MSQIAVLHGFNRLGFTIKEMEEFEKAMSVVTRTEVNQAIKQYLDPNRLTISAAGPTKTMEKELKALVNKL
jgi:predicted Zn-dependent peptidase